MLVRVKMARSVFYYHLARLNDIDGHADMRKRIKAIMMKIKAVTDTEESAWIYAIKAISSTTRPCGNSCLRLA